MHVCNGDGIVDCYVLPGSPDLRAPQTLHLVESAAQKTATNECSTVKYGVDAGQQTCLVAARWHNHALVAFVEPHIVRDQAHGLHVDGTLVTVSAG